MTRQRTATGTTLGGNSYDNTGDLDANTWRHVAFIEQAQPRKELVDLGMPAWDCPAGKRPRDPARTCAG